MKKIILIAALMMAGALSANAGGLDSLRFSLRFGLASAPIAAINMYDDGSLFGSEDYVYCGYNTLGSIYGDYNGPIKSTGAFIVEGQAVVNQTISGALLLGITPVWNDVFSGIDGSRKSRESGLALCFMPKIHVNYLNRPRVNLYCSFALGTTWYIGYEGLKSSYTSGGVTHYEDDSRSFAIQYSPIGLEFKFGKWGVFGELGIGTLYVGTAFGAVYNF